MAALRRYTQVRLPRVRRIQEIAFRNATEFHLPDGDMQAERDTRLRDLTAGDPIRDSSWLFDYDAEHELARGQADS